MIEDEVQGLVTELKKSLKMMEEGGYTPEDLHADIVKAMVLSLASHRGTWR